MSPRFLLENLFDKFLKTWVLRESSKVALIKFFSASRFILAAFKPQPV